MKFITDRTEEDVVNKTPKGYINYRDLNRIEKNIGIAADVIGVNVDIKTDWKPGDLLLTSEFDRFEQNLRTLHAGYEGVTDVHIPDRPYNTFEKWNMIEKLIYTDMILYVRNSRYTLYVGEIYAGDEIGVI